MSDIQDTGMRLARTLNDNLTPPSAPTVRYGTLQRVYANGGSVLADVQVSGGELYGLPVTREAADARSGDRVMVLTAQHLSTVIGVMARQSACKPLFDWSSTWSGTPGDSLHKETEKTVDVYGGLVLCEFRAALKGSGEYGMVLTFLDTAGTTKAQFAATSPPMAKADATLRWTQSGTVYLEPGSYTVKLETSRWGSIEIKNGDNTMASRMWRDGIIGTAGVNRMARISQL